jgi:hypothetical protein
MVKWISKTIAVITKWNEGLFFETKFAYFDDAWFVAIDAKH